MSNVSAILAIVSTHHVPESLDGDGHRALESRVLYVLVAAKRWNGGRKMKIDKLESCDMMVYMTKHVIWAISTVIRP